MLPLGRRVWCRDGTLFVKSGQQCWIGKQIYWTMQTNLCVRLTNQSRRGCHFPPSRKPPLLLTWQMVRWGSWECTFHRHETTSSSPMLQSKHRTINCVVQSKALEAVVVWVHARDVVTNSITFLVPTFTELTHWSLKRNKSAVPYSCFCVLVTGYMRVIMIGGEMPLDSRGGLCEIGQSDIEHADTCLFVKWFDALLMHMLFASFLRSGPLIVDDALQCFGLCQKYKSTNDNCWEGRAHWKI